MADIGGVRLHYRLDGPEGLPVVVLSNSLGADLGMWAPQLDAFAHRFRVLRYDSRGHGASAVPPGPYGVDQLGDDVLRLLDTLGIARARFCGLSLGGLVGQWLGLHGDGRIDRLVLCNTAARIGTDALWNARIAAVEAGGMAALAEAVFERWFTPSFRAQPSPAAEQARRALAATPPAGYAACCAALRDCDLRRQVAGIAVPTLVVTGHDDAATPPAEGRWLAQAIPGARQVELAAAHLSNIEAADAFTAAVLDFLSA